MKTLRKIHIAFSWRNGYYSDVIETLRKAGHEVMEALEFENQQLKKRIKELEAELARRG